MGKTMKNLGLATIIATSIVLLAGCGGSSGDSDPMNEKNYIIVVTSVPSGICESTAFTNELNNLGLRDFITRETDNTTSCVTYGKVNDGLECAMEFNGRGNVNCVVGFNDIPQGYGGYRRQTAPVELYNTIELVSLKFQ